MMDIFIYLLPLLMFAVILVMLFRPRGIFNRRTNINLRCEEFKWAYAFFVPFSCIDKHVKTLKSKEEIEQYAQDIAHDNPKYLSLHDMDDIRQLVGLERLTPLTFEPFDDPSKPPQVDEEFLNSFNKGFGK